MRWKMVVFDAEIVIWKMQVDTATVFIFFIDFHIHRPLFFLISLFSASSRLIFRSSQHIYIIITTFSNYSNVISNIDFALWFCKLQTEKWCAGKKISIFLEVLNLDFNSRKFPSRQKAHNKKSGSIFSYLFSTFCHVEGVHLIKCAEKIFENFYKKKVDQFFSN